MPSKFLCLFFHFFDVVAGELDREELKELMLSIGVEMSERRLDEVMFTYDLDGGKINLFSRHTIHIIHSFIHLFPHEFIVVLFVLFCFFCFMLFLLLFCVFFVYIF